MSTLSPRFPAPGAPASPPKVRGLAALLLLAPLALPPQEPAAAFDHSHARWTAVLREHVRGERFDYAALKADPAPLREYLRELQAVTPAQLAGWTREQRYAFWLNVYNAYTVKKVTDNYPLESIRDLSRVFGLKSVFDEPFLPLPAHHPEGKDRPLSLNDVEHEILRARFRDPRVHAALNCASLGCPPLLAEAFVAERLEEQLDERMRSFLADRSRNRIDREAGALELSKIFRWFAEDFEREAGSVAAYVARFVPEEDRELVRTARIRYLDYDWSLNDVPREEGGRR